MATRLYAVPAMTDSRGSPGYETLRSQSLRASPENAENLDNDRKASACDLVWRHREETGTHYEE